MGKLDTASETFHSETKPWLIRLLAVLGLVCALFHLGTCFRSLLLLAILRYEKGKLHNDSAKGDFLCVCIE